MTIEQHIEALDLQGFTVIPDAMTSTQLAAARAAIDRLIAAQAAVGQKPSYANANLTDRADIFRDLVQQPTLLQIVDTLLGDDCILSGVNHTTPMPGAPAGPIHRDRWIWGPSLFWMDHPIGINVGWCFDDFTEENGATLVAPGSHRAQDEPPAEAYVPMIASTTTPVPTAPPNPAAPPSSFTSAAGSSPRPTTNAPPTLSSSPPPPRPCSAFSASPARHPSNTPTAAPRSYPPPAPPTSTANPNATRYRCRRRANPFGAGSRRGQTPERGGRCCDRPVLMGENPLPLSNNSRLFYISPASGGGGGPSPPGPSSGPPGPPGPPPGPPGPNPIGGPS